MNARWLLAATLLVGCDAADSGRLRERQVVEVWAGKMAAVPVRRLDEREAWFNVPVGTRARVGEDWAPRGEEQSPSREVTVHLLDGEHKGHITRVPRRYLRPAAD